MFGKSDGNVATKTKIDPDLSNFVERSAGKRVVSDFYWIETREIENIQTLSEEVKGFGNLQRINDIQRINKFLEKANRKMNQGQYLMVCMETQSSRKERILNKFPKVISYPYYVLDFILKRVFPKWTPTQKIYFWITNGRNRVLSLSEGLARLICCGFEIENFQKIGYKTYILAKKISSPAYDMDPTYQLIVKLKRIVKDGELVDFYKLRTMHPYSEYLQEYLYERNGTKDGDKIKNDFRVTSWGKVFRKFWIDELPMLCNLLKGDIKLVGVRPLSEHKFYTYPEELQEKRTKIKPGLVPPYYVDLPETPEEFYKTEERYLDRYFEKPLWTDIVYFFKALYNIFFKGARSK